jgi:hypothetical protein
MRRIGGGSTVRGVRTARLGAIWRVAIAGAALAGACSSAQQPRAPSDQPVDLNAPAGQRSQSDETVVVVDNQNLYDMTIYAYQGTQRMRLGRARGTATTTLKIPKSIVSGVTQMRFFAQPMGNQRSYLSEVIPVQPGDQVEWMIPAR